MNDYIVEAKSRNELRDLANTLRKKLGLWDAVLFPIVEILDIMCEMFKGFMYEIVPDSTFPPEIHADTNIRKKLIRIKESIYDGACRGNGRDRMTIAHEIGHYLTLCFCEFTLKRNFTKTEIVRYCSPEWQAKCFAGELLIPRHLTKNMSISEIEEACGVSHSAAVYQYRIMHNT